MKENSIKNERSSIEEDIKNVEHFIKSIKTDKEYKEENGWHGYYNKEIVELARMLEHILSDYKRVLKMNEVLLKENEELNYKLHSKKITLEIYNRYIPKSKVEEIIDRIDYDIKKTKEIISNNSNIYTSDRKNDYQIIRLRGMNTKSLDIKERLQKLIKESEE